MDWKAAFKTVKKAVKSFLRPPGKLEQDLFKAVQDNDLPRASALIAEGANVGGSRFGYDNPLQEAATRGHVEMAKLLLSAGADPNASVYRGENTPFHAAVKNGSLELVAAMLAAKADVNKHGRRGDTPLIYAVAAKNRPLVELLLEKGADINARNEARWRPLSYAMHNGDSALITLLLEKGARTNIVDIDRRSLFDIAEAADKPEGRKTLQDFMDARVQEWQPLDAGTVARVRMMRQLDYKLTEVFNFETKQCTLISHNFTTGLDSLTVKPFAEIGAEAVAAAAARLEKQKPAAAPAAGPVAVPAAGSVTAPAGAQI